MEQYLALYRNSPLFQGVPEEDLLPLLGCLQAQKHTYAKGELIFSAGERITQLGILLSGRINTVYEDVMGGRSILESIEPGQLFGDAYCCTKGQLLPVSIAAQTESTVLLIEIDLILHTCAQACKQHQRLCENLVHILAEKYLTLSQKSIHLSGRSTRRKLLSYLSAQMQLAGGNPFTLPFNQQELADYLYIERSGLSTELNKLKKEGILQVQGGRFTLQIVPCSGADCDE